MEPTHFESLYPASSREKEIRQILTCIKSGNFNQTISLPGGGRSQVLRLFAYNRSLREKHLGEKEKLFHFVLCNFSEVRNKSLDDVLRFLYSSLTDSLASRHSGNPPDGGASRISIHHEGNGEILEFQAAPAPQNDALFHSLKKAIEHLTLEKNMIIVFLFDNFDEYLPMVSPDFFKDLKILRSSAIYKFSTVFAVNRPLEDLLDPQVIADIYQFIADHKVYLNLYDKPSLEFRINSIEKALNKTIEKENLQHLIALTGGHINLTRLCVETILESNIDLSSFWGGRRFDRLQNLLPQQPPVQRDSGQARMTNAKLDSSLAEFLLRHKSIQAALLDIWNSLTPAEQNLLMINDRALRHSGNQAKPEHPESEILNQVQNDKRDSGLARMTESYLDNIGILKNGKITISLLEDFLKQNPSLQAAPQHIVLDKTTKEIKKGTLPLSDKLTAFEYNLLRFLLENLNRVVERDEVINAVWKEEKSMLGVTNQALDQLVFRLRRKIENGPNNPVHLQTVKGRGFRFTQ